MDTFAYQPPNTHSPGRYANSPSAGPADPSSSSFAPRPGSSSGAHASGGFTATLPPLQEHASTDVSGANGSGAVGGTRPTLVEFEQLAGEDAFGGIGGDAGDGVNGQSGFAGAASGVGFRDPFGRPGSTGGQAQAGAGGGMFAAGLNGASSQSPSHAYFNPQTINPSVNTRNTRPMTAPSGHGYIGSHSYSAAPSNFYAPAQPTGPPGVFDSFHGAPPHTAVPPGPSSFQYQVDSNPHAAEFDSYRARGFSLPDVNGNTLGMGVDPLVQVNEGTSPPSSTPFFYTPPAVQTVRPMTTGGMFYPAVLDPHASAVMPAPLMGAPGSVLPPGVPFGPYSSDTSRPGSSSGAAITARRRSSGGTTAQAASGKQYNFVQQGGQVTKRPRRRYDEIERMYNCDYPGCTKAYGTLNHLNSHKTMQKHGPKSTPARSSRRFARHGESGRRPRQQPQLARKLPVLLNTEARVPFRTVPFRHSSPSLALRPTDLDPRRRRASIMSRWLRRTCRLEGRRPSCRTTLRLDRQLRRCPSLADSLSARSTRNSGCTEVRSRRLSAVRSTPSATAPTDPSPLPRTTSPPPSAPYRLITHLRPSQPPLINLPLSVPARPLPPRGT
ncbi:zinc finger, C2H4-type domain containing protein [Rhodotorula toruloides NP11]|uniref:Zinc finger, C2H4-type domain containing protein n=1 Tax=Rhodotorula toruloides (strain NP11) TaxID=1130832 RepID=M7WTF3_RHOT1|nr:zinc finger, C2H4-type domain containing protein [Rhodotorula toruloides NP11]EMS21160.1 zinc finger, C2H4-type domain containing protein [Rhodotorula toruloides NP11]